MVGLSPAVVSGLRVAGPAFFLGMQGSSVLTARGILEDKSVGQLSPLPFVSLLTNCIIWSFYGLLRKDSTVLVPNAIGIVSGLGCVLAYQKHAPSFPTTLYAGASLIVLVSTLLASMGNYNLIGSIGCGLAVIVMGSPLATLKTVIQSRSTAALPFPTSFMGFCNSLSWSAYGLLVANDVMIYGPNLVGLFLSSIQMLLFAVFGLPPSRAALPKSVF
jgi:solute carrier family 50 (sugar transporter)